MPALRPYQHEAVTRTLAALLRSPLLVSPTGSGKTVMGVSVVEQFQGRVCWMAHRTELIEQAAERFTEPVGIIKAGYPTTPLARVQVASVQTLVRRPHKFDLYVVDEAHHACADSYRSCLPDGVPRLGLTATPFRLDGRGLGRVFGEIIEAANIPDLIRDKHLVFPEVWIVGPPDLSGAKVKMGDYESLAIEAAMDTAPRRASIVEHWYKRCEGMRTLCFATSIAHSKAIVDAFDFAGVAAEHVDGSTSAADRKATLDRLRSGETLVVSNCELFTEGTDLPDVRALIIARPTASLNLHMQMIGRVMRPAPDKPYAVVNDHAGNHSRHGRVSEPLTYSLDDTCGVKKTSEPLGLRTCAKCFYLYAGPFCPECGEAPAPVEADYRVDGDCSMVLLGSEDDKEDTFNRLCEEASALGFKPGYPYMKFKEKYGEYPRTYTVDGVTKYMNAEKADAGIKRAYYKSLLELCIEKGWSHGAASHRYKEAFGVWPTGFVTAVKAELGLEPSPRERLAKVWK